MGSVASLLSGGLYVVVAIIALLVLLILIKVSNFIVIIGGTNVGILERRYLGRNLSSDRVIALPGEIGIQAKTLGPGLYFLFPFLFTVRKVGFVTIGQDQVGLVEAIDGNPLQPGNIFARSVAGHDHFQNGEIFLGNGGQKGPQVDVIPPGVYRINTILFRISVVPATTIGQDEIGLVEAIDGKPLQAGNIFARSVEGHEFFQRGEAFLQNGGQKGPQVDVMPPGNYRINRALFSVEICKIVNIKPNFVGIVTANDGQPIDPGRLLAKSTPGHNNYQDGNAFLINNGQKGPQIDVLLPGSYRINPKVFKVEITEAYIVKEGQIGLITANDGLELPSHELVARSIPDHNSYQNASNFLINGGQRGPQLDILLPGVYYINPLMFTMRLDQAAVVEQGQVAVVISNVGKEPGSSVAVGDLNDRGEKIERYVVPKGFRGIQSEVMGPGTYYINRIAFNPLIVKTTNITIDWDDAKETKFDPLSVVSKDGFEIKIGVKVVIRVQPEQAPYMVARIGSIENLINNVIHPLIDSSFRNQASSTQAMEFLQDRHEQQAKALDRAVNELSKYHVEVLSVLICQINLPADLMETQTNKVLAAQRQSMYTEQREAEFKRIAMERTKAEADKQATLVAAEIDVKVADQTKMKTITVAQGDAERIRLEGQGEADKVLAIGKATAEAYELTRKAVGQEVLGNIELMKLISSGNIKITPEIMVAGGDGGINGSLVNTILAGMLRTGKTKKEDGAVTEPTG